VAVTRRSIRAGSWYFRQKVVPVARQVWRAFCRPGTSFITCRRGRGTSLINGREIVTVDEAQKRHWRRVAMQFVSEPEICHGAECLLRVAARVRMPG
jgi:hypothetical protein